MGNHVRGPLAQRFWAKVNRRGPEECWEWTASRYRFGYGVIYANGKMGRSNRVAWELTNGPIPDGMEVCHRCDNPPCCNPTHLFLGTHQDNVRDCFGKGRMPRAGERNGRSKLTWESVGQMRQRLAAGGITKSELARQFGVTHEQVANVVSGRQWKTARGHEGSHSQ